MKSTHKQENDLEKNVKTSRICKIENHEMPKKKGGKLAKIHKKCTEIHEKKIRIIQNHVKNKQSDHTKCTKKTNNCTSILQMQQQKSTRPYIMATSAR